MEPMGKKQSFRKLAKLLHASAPPEKRKAFADLRKSAKSDGGTGRKGDKHVVHVNDAELAMLHFMTDGGSINPKTGMMEFFDDEEGFGDGDSDSGDEDIGGDGDDFDEVESIGHDFSAALSGDRDYSPVGSAFDSGPPSGGDGESPFSLSNPRNAAATAAGIIGTVIGGPIGAGLSAISGINTASNVVSALSRTGSPMSPSSREPGSRGGGARGLETGVGDVLGAPPKAEEKPAPTTLGTPEVRRKKAGRAASVLTGSKGVLGSAAVDRPSLRTSSLLG